MAQRHGLLQTQKGFVIWLKSLIIRGLMAPAPLFLHDSAIGSCYRTPPRAPAHCSCYRCRKAATERHRALRTAVDVERCSTRRLLQHAVAFGVLGRWIATEVFCHSLVIGLSLIWNGFCISRNGAPEACLYSYYIFFK